MEELFHYMTTLRSQMNDVADQAAKISVEEHMLWTTIQTLQKDLDSVKTATKQVKKENDEMIKVKGQISLQISEKKFKIASLETDSTTLNQTIDLMHQQKLSMSSKLKDRSVQYTKITDDICGELKELQQSIKAHKFPSQAREISVNAKTDGDAAENLSSAKAKLEELEHLKSSLVLKSTKLRESVEQLKTKINFFKPELQKMDNKSLEEELQSVLSDKAGQSEYIQSLQLQITKLKEISNEVKCSCGEQYIVKLDLCD